VEVNGIFDMGFEVIQERSSHVDNTNRGVIDHTRQFSCLNESGVVKIFERRGFGIEEGWNKKEK
jgi:hypothetical protein